MPFDTGINNIHLLRVGTLTIFKISGHILFKRVRTSPGGYKEQEYIWLKIWDLHHLKDIWSFSVEGEGKDQSITGGHDLQIIYCPLTQEFRIYMVSAGIFTIFKILGHFLFKEGGDHDNPMGNDLHINLCALTKGPRISMHVV